MTQSISIVHCPSEASETQLITLQYVITADAAVYTISCSLGAEWRQHLSWLSKRKFEVRLLKQKGKYIMLHNSDNDVWNLDTSRFIDAACAAILKQESWQCVA